MGLKEKEKELSHLVNATRSRQTSANSDGTAIVSGPSNRFACAMTGSSNDIRAALSLLKTMWCPSFCHVMHRSFDLRPKSVTNRLLLGHRTAMGCSATTIRVLGSRQSVVNSAFPASMTACLLDCELWVGRDDGPGEEGVMKLQVYMHSSASKRPEWRMDRHAALPVCARPPINSMRGNAGC